MSAPESVETTKLDDRTILLLRLAALVAVDAPEASYVLNLGASRELGLDEQTAKDVLEAVAPILGTARTVSGLSKIVRALGLALEIGDLAE